MLTSGVMTDHVPVASGRGAQERYAPERYTPEWLPTSVAQHAAVPDMLPVGAPGKVGLLDLRFEMVDGRTELTEHFQAAPLHIPRALYLDPEQPDMPYVMIMSSGGGILQGDRCRADLYCGAGTSVHITTQTATRLYRMEQDYATQLIGITAAPGSYVEYLPETTIPFGGSRFYQQTTVTADPEATVVIGEKLMAGRLARGERHAYTAYCTDLEVRAPDGRLLFADPIRLIPDECPVSGPGVMADFGVMASLYVVTGAKPAQEVADAMHQALARTGLLGGASVLPHEVGAWARVFGDRSPETEAAFHQVWDAVRQLLLDGPAPDRRR